jgi:hypothetical protein
LNFSIITKVFGIEVPEKDINLKIENLTRGCDVYLLLPENLIKYNMEKFISNNKDNEFSVEAEEAEKIEEYLDNNDYLGYINYFLEIGFEVESNEIELRHYCFCFGNAKIIGYYEYNNTNYIQVKINLNDENEFKLIMKDYLVNYDARDIKFMINEYNSITYIDLDDRQFTTNSEKSNITECNIVYNFYSNEDYNEIENSIKITYLIIYIILIIIILIILRKLINKHKIQKEEIESRKFWKKKLTKEEKKEEKEKLKQQKKENKKIKKNNK